MSTLNTITRIPAELKPESVSSGAELIPSEVAVRQEREGEFDPTDGIIDTAETKVADGYTVSGQGLINNYAITPPIYTSDKTLAEKRRDYTMLGIVGLSIIGLALGASVVVTMAV